MIRLATLEDIPAIAEMGERFHGEAGWEDIAGYSVEDCSISLRQMIEGDLGIVIVAEDEGRIVGIAGGLIFPLYFNHAHKSGQELFWYVEPGRRDGLGRKLKTALEDEARKAACQSWTMIALDKVSPEATGRLYRRDGYRAAEHSWIRRL
ncbi:MAG TPA: GNAT family N-acetyltransferase [Sphingobium sp.]|nr:GNAT family N-acetyltransferase [Sphingobium sp.]